MLAQPEAEPHYGVEPMYAEGKVHYKLGDVVKAFDMVFFVEYNKLTTVSRNAFGEVDTGRQDTENEWGGYFVRGIDIQLVGVGIFQSFSHSEI